MTSGRIVILSGPSGSGKTSLYQKLLVSRKFQGSIVRTVSVTTRPRRKGERDGRDYHFVSRKRFFLMKKKGELLESQKVFRHYYGTPRRMVEKILKTGRHVLLCIDVKGARVVWGKYPGALRIFIKTPSWSELKKRLINRATESKKDLRMRLRIARKELKEARDYDFIVINDNFAKAYRRLEQIICSQLDMA